MFLLVCLCVCEFMCTPCMHVLTEAKENTCVGTGNQTWVLYKSCLMFSALEPSFQLFTAHFFNEQDDLGVQSEKMDCCSCPGVVPDFWLSSCQYWQHFKRTEGVWPKRKIHTPSSSPPKRAFFSTTKASNAQGVKDFVFWVRHCATAFHPENT